MGLIWTPELDGQLTALHSEGATFSEMAQTIEGATRNACIGRAHRLGLKRKRSYTDLPSPDGKPRKRKVPKREQFAYWSRKRAPEIKLDPIPQPKPTKLVPEVVAISFGDLEKSNCHYPITDDPATMIFCGDRAVDGKPYCKAHMALCYVKPKARPTKEGQSYLIHLFTHAERGGRSLAR